jgi:hypothetical protein
MDSNDSGTPEAPATPGAPATPPPGWYPHPEDPARELYWDGSTWVADTTRPLVVAAGADPHAGMPTPAPGDLAAPPPGVPSYAGAPAPVAPGPVESPAKAAAPSFLLGAAVGIGVSALGLWIMKTHSSGIFWFGGYFVTFAAWRRSWAYYTSTAARTGQGLTPPQKAIAGVLGGLTLILTALFVVQYVGTLTAPKLTAAVGSCWADSGDKVVQVECSDSSAAYIATSTAPTQSSCPDSAEGSISENGVYYCLTRK